MPRIKKTWRLVISAILSLTYIMVLVSPASAQSLIRDTEIEATLREFSDPIIRAAGLNASNVDIFLVNDKSLNAFVTRGQKMFFHTGLILESQTPNQLKGVIAHETGHIAAGHLARSDYGSRSAYGAWLIAAGIGLAAILAGEGQAGALILGGSQQFGTLEVLAYSRANEAAADQYAAQYMERTGQSGKGLIEFFEKFRYQEVLSNARRFPYFRGHPLSSQRIDALREVVDESPHTEVEDSPKDIEKLEIAKAKLRGFLESPQLVFSRYPETDTSFEARYARAVAHFRSASLGSAIREVNALIESDPQNPYFHELHGQILYESGKGQEAIAPLQRAIQLKPDAPLLEIMLSQALIESENEIKVQQAIKHLKSALQKETTSSFAWYYLSQAYGSLGKNALAKYAIAEQAFNSGDMQRARSFAQRAREDLDRGIPQYRRASDIIVVADTELAKRRNRGNRQRPFTFTVK